MLFLTAWHEVDDSKPRFEGRLNVIDELFGRVWKSHEEFSPVKPIFTPRPRSNTFGNENGQENYMYAMFCLLNANSYYSPCPMTAAFSFIVCHEAKCLLNCGN